MSLFAFAVVGKPGAFDVAEVDLTDCESVDDVVDLLADFSAPVRLLGVEQDDEYAVLARLADDSLRVFLSNGHAADDYPVAQLFADGLEEIGGDPLDGDEDAPTWVHDAAPFGDPEVVADLGVPAAQLLELAVHEGTLPSDLFDIVCERLGCSQRARRRSRVSPSRANPAWLDEAMGLALSVAVSALPSGDVPVGAVVLSPSGTVIGQGWNRREELSDVTAHAELLALRSACAELGSWQLTGCTLVATLEPCVMCAGALVQARVERLVFGAWDEKAGACGSVWDVVRDRRLNHRPEVYGGVQAPDCAELLRSFFADRR